MTLSRSYVIPRTSFCQQTLKEAEVYEAELVKREAAKVRKRNGTAFSQSSSRRRGESVGPESDIIEVRYGRLYIRLRLEQ